MSYRKYYWNAAVAQIRVALIMIWHGVICNRGHHSSWGRSWFFKHKR